MIADKLRALTGKELVFITKSGDHAILYALKLVKELGLGVQVQDQGGWITYEQYCKKLKLSCTALKTKRGIVDPLSVAENDALLINSMPGYYALQDMRRLHDICQKKKVLLINDVSGSIGTGEAFFGDLVLGSFGRDKPINLMEGGFIATNNQGYVDFLHKHFVEYKLDEQKFSAEAGRLAGKLAKWREIKAKIVQDLSTYGVLEGAGINVIVLYESEKERENLIKYCSQNGYAFELCPRNIRVMDKAVCIELKRLQ